MLTPRRILVPMDFSDEALLAWDWAVLLTRGQRDAELYPIYVYSTFPDLAALDVGRAEYREVAKEWVEDQMAQLAKSVPKHIEFIPLYSHGNPAEKISESCRTQTIDLVVMTTHGRRGVSHLLHQSVAEGLVRLSPCPVLVLHLNRETLEPVHDEAMQRLGRTGKSGDAA